MTNTIAVPFHGTELYIVNHNGEPFTPMKPIIEGMGMDWASQFTKLKQRFSKGIVEITIPTAGGVQKMICLALRKLAAWLNTISPNKVRPEIRERVIQYQEECDDVLYEYWTTGQVKPKAKSRQCTATQLIPLRQTAERLITTGLGKIYPDIWKLVHEHFEIEHIHQLRPEQISDAVEYLNTIEGEYISKHAKQPKSPQQFKENELLQMVSLWMWMEHARKMSRLVYPALRDIESRLAGDFYDLACESRQSLDNCRSLLSRELKCIAPEARNQSGIREAIERLLGSPASDDITTSIER